MPADRLRSDNVSLFIDGNFDDDCAGHARSLCERGINRFDARDRRALKHAASLANYFRRFGLRVVLRGCADRTPADHNGDWCKDEDSPAIHVTPPAEARENSLKAGRIIS